MWLERPRWGIGVAIGPITRYDVGPLRLGWYLDWNARAAPARPAGAVYAPMIRLRDGRLEPGADEIAAMAVVLSSPLASYVTGARIVVDGGLGLCGLGAISRALNAAAPDSV